MFYAYINTRIARPLSKCQSIKFAFRGGEKFQDHPLTKSLINERR